MSTETFYVDCFNTFKNYDVCGRYIVKDRNEYPTEYHIVLIPGRAYHKRFCIAKTVEWNLYTWEGDGYETIDECLLSLFKKQQYLKRVDVAGNIDSMLRSLLKSICIAYDSDRSVGTLSFNVNGGTEAVHIPSDKE